MTEKHEPYGNKESAENDPQMGLFSRSKLERKFDEFHAANPEVWQLFKRFTFDVMESGQTRYSADAILHRIRWEIEIEKKHHGKFKINNNYSAYYARKFMAKFPAHSDFFETRAVSSTPGTTRTRGHSARARKRARRIGE